MCPPAPLNAGVLQSAFLVEVHAVPARRQPLRLNTKDDPVGRSRHCDLADYLAVSTFETAGPSGFA